jgi:UDPglucose 6-dehydrogenase
VEPELPETLKQHAGRIRYTAEVRDLKRCDLVYIAADVPTDDRGHSDLAGIRSLIDTVAAALSPTATLVILCQVPPGFTRSLAFDRARLYYQVETLIFGRAVERALHPERTIVGCSDPAQPLPAHYAGFLAVFECPVLPMRYESAELAKISINCCLVASVTVANTLAELSERIGADWNEIAPALKLDRRIGQYSYLAPGLGLAGGNLERDLATVLQLSQETGTEAGLIQAFVRNSRHRRHWVLRTLHTEVLARKPDAVIAVLGLAYKENTHSTKNSPSLALISHLKPWRLRVYDPLVAAKAVDHPACAGCDSALDAATGADVVAIMTPWPAFRTINPGELKSRLAGKSVIDPYRVLDGAGVKAAGLDYFTLGMPALRGA